MKGQYVIDLIPVLGENVSFDTLVRLEKVRTRRYDKAFYKREDGYEVSVSRKTSEGEELENELFIRVSNYAYGIEGIPFRTFYPCLDFYIKTRRYGDFSFRFRAFRFVKYKGEKYMVNGSEIVKFSEAYIPLLVSALRERTYFKWNDFLITPLKTTYRGILVDTVGLYLFLEK